MKKDIEWLRSEIVDYFTIEGNGFDVDGYEILDLINQLDEPEVLSQEWIRNNQERKGVHFFVNVTKLQNLVVPKREVLTDEQIARKVDQAYKDGYKKGKDHAFEKVGWVDKEPETVADVVTAFWKSYERLKEAMSMEVAEETE